MLELFLTSINSGRKFSYSILARRAWFFFRVILWFEFVQSALNSFNFGAKLLIWRFYLAFEIFNIGLDSFNYTIQLVNQFGILLFGISLMLFHLILNILYAFVSHAPRWLLSARSSFLLITFSLSLLNKFLDFFLKILIILSNFRV